MSVFSATAQRPIDGLAHRILGKWIPALCLSISLIRWTFS